MMMIIIL